MRFRGKEIGCQGCIRITVGSEAEVDTLLGEMRTVLGDIFNDRAIGEAEDVKEQDANDVVA